MKKPYQGWHLCQVCGKELKQHERAEPFCDACLRAAQWHPIGYGKVSAKPDKVGGND